MAHPSENNRLLDTLTNDATLDAACNYVTMSNKAASSVTDQQWNTIKVQLQKQLASGEYSFSVLTRVRHENKIRDMWTDRDRIVLNALALTLEPLLKTHLSGQSFRFDAQKEAKNDANNAREHQKNNPFIKVIKSSASEYYDNIDHHTLYEQLKKLIPGEQFILRLLWQYMNHVVYDNGKYIDINKGISSDCSLSSLLADLYLQPLYSLFEGTKDNRTRWQLCIDVKKINTCLADLGFEKLSEKTIIARTRKGFEFLGCPSPLNHWSVSDRPAKDSAQESTKLYEHGTGTSAEQYTPRWQKWARAGAGVVAGGIMTIPSTALGAGISLPSLSGKGPVDLDGDFSSDFAIYGSGTTCGVFLYSAPAKVGSPETSSVIFGNSEPSLDSAYPLSPPPAPVYVRVKTTNGYYGWLTVTNCEFSSFYGENPRVSTLKPDGTQEAGNMSPTASGVPTDITVIEDTPSNLDLSTVTFADAEGDPLTITLNASAGTMTATSTPGVTAGGSGTGTLTLSGTIADINTFLSTPSNIQYTGANNSNGGDAATVDIYADDGTNNPLLDSINIDITPQNDPPSVSGVPSDISVLEDTASSLNLSAVTFTDVDEDSVRVTFTASAGSMTATSVPGVTVGGSGTAALTLDGTVSDINTYLDTTTNIQYTGANNASGNDAATITVNVFDGTVNPQLASINIDITAQNDAPTVSGLPADISVIEETSSDLDLSGTTFADVDGDSLTVTLTASTGTLAAASAPGVNVNGSGTGALTLAGTATDINAYLTTTTVIQYTGANNTSGDNAATITVNVNDGTVNPQLALINIDITPLNNPPTVSGVPTDIPVTEETESNLDLSGTTFADVDGDALTVTLTASAGTLTAASTPGVSVSGSGTVALTLAGTAVDINTYLDTISNIKYTGPNNTSGDNAATIAINVNDGTVNPQLAVINIDITPQNNAPTVTEVPSNITVTEDTASDLNLSAATFADTDGDALTVTLTASAGILTATSADGVTVGGNGTDTLTLDGATGSINTYLDTVSSIQYTGAADVNGDNAATVTISATDGTAFLASDPVVIINITAVGDTPSVTPSSTIEDTQTTSGLVISRNANDGTEVTHFKISNITGGTLYQNDGISIISNDSFITFTEGNAGLKFTPSLNSTTEGSFDIESSEDGSTVSTQSGKATATITITPENDAPTFTGTPTITGTALVGQPLELADTETYDAEGDFVSLTYQWKADGLDISEATSGTYTVALEDAGKTITCTLTANDSNGGITTFTTAGVLASNKSTFNWNIFLPSILSSSQNNEKE